MILIAYILINESHTFSKKVFNQRVNFMLNYAFKKIWQMNAN